MGVVDVTVIGTGRDVGNVSIRQLSYAPIVASLTPTFGPAAGGTPVTLSGSNFTGATAVDFGTTAGTNLTVVNDTTITVDSPAGTGVVDVTVVGPGGRQQRQHPTSFRTAPVVASLTPAIGPAAGGTPVTLSGSNFTGATAVDFGTTAGTNLTVVNDTTITVDSPAGTGGVDVTVVGPGGTSTTLPADQFTYAPVVASLTPTFGPAAGGTLVTITGAGFTGATAVDFGTTAATNLSVVNDTTITVDSPAGTGIVDVTVVGPGGTSTTLPADQFTYAPVVASLTPTFGPAAGGTAVTLTGTNFTGATEVDFGTTAATNLTVVNDTTIMVDSPAGAGIVDVTVIGPGGTSATSASDKFAYAAGGFRTEPDVGPAGRWHDRDHYRHQLHGDDGRRLRRDRRDKFHRCERYHDQGDEPRGDGRR